MARQQDLFERMTKLRRRPADVPEVPPPELVSFVVRWNRHLRQWKKSTLADFAQVSVSTIERVERGERVGVEALDRIGKSFGYEAGYFTDPRLRLKPETAAEKAFDTFGHLEMVPVAPMKTHRAVRDAAFCDAVLIHRPDVPEAFDAELENLREWLDLASFILTTKSRTVVGKRGRRDLYNDILTCVRELERRGLTVLSGVMQAPQDGLPDWTVAIISVTTKLRDPGAAKRQYLMVDTRSVAFPAHAGAT